MEMGAAQGNHGATIEGSGKLRKEKVVKIRMDAVELLELDDIGQKLGFRERATTIRTLMQMFRELEQSRRIVAAYKEQRDAQARFAAIMDAV